MTFKGLWGYAEKERLIRQKIFGRTPGTAHYLAKIIHTDKDGGRKIVL